jgi:hypothetical protein
MHHLSSLLLLESSKTGWKTRESLKRTHPQSVTFDHRNPNGVYCDTFGDGLWKSDDGVKSWDRIALPVSLASIVMSSIGLD